MSRARIRLTAVIQPILAASALLVAAASPARADVRLPAIFGSHMVLQRGQPIRIWGRSDPGESVKAAIAGHRGETVADNDGRWRLELPPLEAGGPHTLSVEGKNAVSFEDVLVGEVWLCSGQSNMQWPVQASNDADLEIRAAKFPRLRLITVPQVGTQEPQEDFKGRWEACTPETVADFSAVGYFFGRQLHETLGVPIGLIDNSWGGSAAEAWVRRDLLAADERYRELLEHWEGVEKSNDPKKLAEDHEKRLEEWARAVKAAEAAGQPPPRRPSPPSSPLGGQHRPANLYNGVLKPVLGYPMRGAIWYQGETNAGRAYQYRELFPLLIKSWRDEWRIGEFPFYWVQLADFKDERPEPGDSDWAELREAQTMTLARLPKTGEAVIIDIGEGKDIHPRNKQDVAKRLARWALARDYGIDIACRSPSFKAIEIEGGKAVISFDHAGGGLDSFDTRDPRGFAIAGADRKFVWAKAKIAGKDRVEVWSDQVPAPVAVRYAWADNPVASLKSREGLPATPFRTDDWPGVTAGKNK
jgi:sialate O-acetylesterase